MRNTKFKNLKELLFMGDELRDAYLEKADKFITENGYYEKYEHGKLSEEEKKNFEEFMKACRTLRINYD